MEPGQALQGFIRVGTGDQLGNRQYGGSEVEDIERKHANENDKERL